MSIRERLQHAKQKGARYFFGKLVSVPAREVGYFFTYLYLKGFSKKKFMFDGVALPYEYHRYNTTWQNERTVEVPIGRYTVQAAAGKSILEVGNTLKYYYPYEGDVIDKYEVAPGVINADIAEFSSDKMYDLILSLSTMEHVGFDEAIKDPEKIRRSLVILAGHLKKGGRMLVTMPLGYNPSLDENIKRGELPFTQTMFFKRINTVNEWKQVDAPAWPEVSYNKVPISYANWIIVGIIEK